MSRFIYLIMDALLLSINITMYIPRMVLAVYRKEKDIVIFVPLFFSILAFYFNPTYEYDLFRHYQSYELYINNYSEGFNKDFFLYGLFVIGKFFNFSRGFLPFISCFLIYFSLSSVFIKIHENDRSLSGINYIFSYILVLSSVSLVLYTGIRFSSSVAAFCLGIYYFAVQGRVRFLSLILFSPLIHVSMLLPVLIFLFCLCFNLGKNYNRIIHLFLLAFSLFFGLNSHVILEQLVNIINSFNLLLGASIDIATYITGTYGKDRISGFNSTGQLIYNISIYAKLMVIVIHYISSIDRTDLLSRFNMVLSCACISIIQYSTFYGRYSQVLIVCLIYSILSENNKNFSKKILLLLLFVYLIFFRLIDLKDNISVYINSYYDFNNLSLFNLIYDLII
ncbi:hypothetical protein EA004_06300 [Vibrio anguillarum]|nr:hypothetical protein [Vibrio anguillarum]